MAAWSEVDLHVHSTASDGVFSPTHLVGMARERGLRVLALSDHDSVEGIDEAIAAAQGAVLEIVPAVELNTDTPAGEAHVLGYYLKHHDPWLQELLAGRRAARLERGEKMVARLLELGMEVSWERVQDIAGAATGGAVGRPHVAQAMVERGHVATIKEAFDRFLGRDGPAYVAYARFAPEDAVRAIRQAGGVPVLAHPASLPDFEAALPGLIEAGLAGLECYYGTWIPQEVQRMVQIARAHGLICTGGSDFHGPLPTSWSETVGGTPVPWQVIEDIRRIRDASRLAST